jgi:hypothetical protein
MVASGSGAFSLFFSDLLDVRKIFAILSLSRIDLHKERY